MLIAAILRVVSLAHAATCASFGPAPVRPAVRLDDATFLGTRWNMTDAYLGIKFAEAP